MLLVVVAGCQEGSVGDPALDAAAPDAEVALPDARAPFCGDAPGGDCCHDDDDCAELGCLGPTESPPCGAPNDEPGDCTIDDECDPEASGQICEPIACSTIDARRCVPGCTGDDDCRVGEVCGDPVKRCFAQPCDPGNPCPADFHCDESFCARDVCVDDADCDGWCVEGVCQEQLGVCTPPAP